MKALKRWTVLASLMWALAGVSAIPQDALEIGQTLSKASIAVRPCQGEAETTTVTLTLKGGQAVTPVDVVLVLDRSSSEDLAQVQDAARRFLDHLNPEVPDRVALVSFAEVARVEQSFTSDFEAVRDAIGALRGGQRTALGDALALALDALEAQGRDEAVRAVVVFSDGGATAGLDPLAQAERAARLELPVYFVGISAKVNRGALSELAKRAAGKFFASATTQSLIGVLKRLERELLAQFITVSQTLPDALQFAGTPTGALPPRLERNPRTEATTLSWEIEALLSGEVWQAQFEVSARRNGTFTLAPEAKVSYLSETGQRRTQTIPPVELNVTGTPPPRAAFEMEPAQPKANQVVQFFDRSLTYGTTLKSWQWAFGDGTESTEQNPTHVYRDLGPYTVRLTVTDDQGCAVTEERTFRIFEVLPGPGLRIVLTPSQARKDQALTFSVAPMNDVQACAWDFGDGATSDQCQASHTYAQPGNYTVKLTVTFTDGTTVTTSRRLMVLGPPGEGPPVDEGELHLNIVPAPDQIKVGGEVKLSVSPLEGVSACRWDFGDGTTSDQCQASHTYAREGTFTLEVTVTLADGQTRTFRQPITVARENKRPLAGFTFSPPNPRMRQPVAFDSTISKDDDGTIQAWSWDFGDGQKSEAPNPVHEYQRPGPYTVTLVVTDNDGAQSEPTQKTLTVGIPREAFAKLKLQKGPEVPEWMAFYLDGGVVTDEELDDAARRFANGSYVQGTRYRLTEADLRALTELHDLRVLTQKYLDPQAAEADGYVKVGPYRPGLGQDYVHEELLNEEKPPRFDRPPVLMYAKNDTDQLELAGVSYVALEEDEAVLFGLKGWPAVTPPGLERKIFVLTVWIWRENPEGMFVPLNPDVK